MNPEFYAAATIAINEGLSVEEIYARGPMDLAIKNARMNMNKT